jgi:hypothetical protein
MIPKIVWPTHDFDPNPFGGAKGIRPLAITFQSRVEGGISEKEQRALEILDELVVQHEINVMSFNGRYYPRIFFVPSKSSDEINLEIIESDRDLKYFCGSVPASYMSRDSVISLMGRYSSGREQEFIIARDDLLEARAHQALNRDIFVTTSQFLVKNRENLEELNIRTPSEALKIVGLYISRTYARHIRTDGALSCWRK